MPKAYRVRLSPDERTALEDPCRRRSEKAEPVKRALVQRGSLTVWLSEEATRQWEYDGPRQQGAQFTHPDLAIETCLTLKAVYRLGLRQRQGFVASLLRLMDLELPAPDYSTLSRRAADLSISLCAQKEGTEEPRSAEEPRHIVIDSTGLKVYGEGEWKQRQHGKSKRRTWRKVHLALDPETGEITATGLTENSKHDCSQVEPLLSETVEEAGPVGYVGGDGAYDKGRGYEAIATVGAEPVIPPQKNARIKQDGNSKGPPLPRDEAIRYIRRHGRKEWKREHGYHRRSLAEAGVWRFKQIVGRVLRSRDLARQRTEARIGSEILNVMARLGMPDTYVVALA